LLVEAVRQKWKQNFLVFLQRFPFCETTLARVELVCSVNNCLVLIMMKTAVFETADRSYQLINCRLFKALTT